jgi:hypothetical protein
MKKVISCFWFVIVLCACHSNSIGKKEYINYLQDPKNGLKKEVAVGDFIYEFQ